MRLLHFNIKKSTLHRGEPWLSKGSPRSDDVSDDGAMGGLPGGDPALSLRLPFPAEPGVPFIVDPRVVVQQRRLLIR